MRILFLQYWHDMYGGAETVNHTLATQFKKDGYDVKVECMYVCGKNENIDDVIYKKEYICAEPKRPSYKIMIKNLYKFRFQEFFLSLKECFCVKRKKINSYIILKNRIESYNPDWIIVTNPELIEHVPKIYLKKCFIHIHSACEVYLKDKSLKKIKKILYKYQNKVNKLIWLTESFMEEGKYYGLYNCTYIYNPVRIRSDKVSKLNTNNAVFICIKKKKKRVYLLTKIFSRLSISDNKWNLNIYGSGEDKNIVLNENVKLCGSISDVKRVLLNSSIFCLTSSSEGFPMVVLEAYECGVPVITFDFKTSCVEVVKNGETGFVVKMDDEEEYLNKLTELCNNKKLRQEMGKNAKEYVKKFYPEEVAKSWYKLFKGEL